MCLKTLGKGIWNAAHTKSARGKGRVILPYVGEIWRKVPIFHMQRLPNVEYRKIYPNVLSYRYYKILKYKNIEKYIWISKRHRKTYRKWDGYYGMVHSQSRSKWVGPLENSLSSKRWRSIHQRNAIQDAARSARNRMASKTGWIQK